MPRAYSLGQRQITTEQNRTRILEAARELLMTSENLSGFSLDAVARQADVARMTVYYQFGSKIGLLEALCDFLANRGGMEQMATAFRQPDPLDALKEYLNVFSRFWNSDRLVTRRLRAIAAFDPELAQVIKSRDERRQKGLNVILQRIMEKYGRPAPETLVETVNLLCTLLSFEFFDTLAGSSRSMEEMTPQVWQLVQAAIGLPTE